MLISCDKNKNIFREIKIFWQLLKYFNSDLGLLWPIPLPPDAEHAESAERQLLADAVRESDAEGRRRIQTERLDRCLLHAARLR